MAHLNQPIISPLLVGRVEERAFLQQALTAARQGTGTVVLLAGEAGVGKSRLVSETRQQAVGSGFDVRTGHCFEGDAGYAYAPLLDALRAWFSPLPAAAVATLLGPHAAEVVKLLPELIHLVPDMQPTAALDAEAEKRRLAESLYHVLVQSALPPRPKPLLLIVEDLHWSDESSLGFLHLLARRAQTLPLLVIGTYRRDDSLPHHRHWQHQLMRERLAHKLELQPLSLDEMNTMVQAIFELALPLQRETAQWLHSLTEGNPFYVEEVLKSLIENGSVYLENGQWARKSLTEIQVPASIQDAVNRRTAWLSPDARRVLTLAAVAGRRFDFALLQQVTGHHEETLLALIKELVAAQLMVEESAERFAFRHALTQQAIYSGLLARERQPPHQKVGEALEQLNAATLGTHAAHLSRHFYVAGVWEKALKYAQLAGEQAQALFEPRAAIVHWTRALDAADHLARPPARLAMLRGRGWAYDILGQIEEARRDYEAALHLARTEGDQLAEWQSLLDLGALWAARDYSQAGDYFQQALDLARRSEESHMIAHSLNRVGNWHVNLDQPHAALHLHQEALQIFESLNDPHGQVATLDFLGMTSLVGGDLLSSVSYYEQALPLSQALNDRVALSSIWANIVAIGPSHLGEALIWQPSPLHEEARTSEMGRHLAQEIGWRAGEAYARLAVAQVNALRGNYRSALANAQEARAIAEVIEHREWMASAHGALARYHWELLALEPARVHALAALDWARQSGSTIWILVSASLLTTVHLTLGDVEAAELVLRSVASMDRDAFTLANSNYQLAMARLALAKGEPARALRVVDALIAATPNSERADVQQPASVLLLRGEALLALGEEAEAESVLARAQASAAEQAAAPVTWRILTKLAMLYQRQRRHDESTAAAADARAVIEQIAQSIDEQALREEFIKRAYQQLPQLGRRRRTRTLATAGGLTAREVEVAELIAQGLSNREIAAQLVVTERTVTTHISHIFDKLDFRTRTQIAAWMTRQGERAANAE